MIPFLYNVAQTYYNKYGAAISRYTFVFPNRRAGLFFQKYLSEIAQKPLFSPEILTISDLFERMSGYKKADRIEMLFLLYDLYVKISKSTESFDEFLYWGDMLLNDFDDVDKYLVDAKQLFHNIHDLKEIDSGFSFLSSEQVEAIRRFWSNFLPVGENEKKKDFQEMWEVLYELYISLRESLMNKGLAYEGMIFREVAEKAKAKEDLSFDFEKIVFVGLNGHSKSEETLLKYLQNRGVADFYWDYSSPLVCDPQNRASFFISKNRTQFPSQLELQAEEQSIFKPTIDVVGIPSAVGQAKYVYEIIEGLIAEQQISLTDEALNTAIVLPDENLLIPTLYSIPEKIEKINVTMGYSLQNSSVSGLMEYVFDVQRNIRQSGSGVGYYFRPVMSILNHRYVIHILGEQAKEIRDNIVRYNKIIVSQDDLNRHPLLSLIFTPVTDWTEASDYIKNILAFIQSALSSKRNSTEEIDSKEPIDTRSIDIECEFIIEYYKMVNRLEDVLSGIMPQMAIETYFKLLKKLIVGISVPFSGEPLSGLQVMGVLETRALDFDNLIILSMNEGIFPMKRATNSFIPYNLRQGFELPTYEHQDSIFAYHFYRLINRAKRIFLLYDTRTEGLQTGEVSRYYNQIKYLYNDSFDITEKVAVYKVSSSESLTISVRKTPEIQKRVDAFLTGGGRNLSASAINMYLNCPLQFYFSVVEKMEEEEEVAETIESSMFGTIFHAIMEAIYERLEGKMVTADLLHKIASDDKYLTELIEYTFAREYFKIDKIKKLTGQNYLTGEVLRKYVKQVLKTDAGLTPFVYEESEERIEWNYILPSGKSVSMISFIDRVDIINGRTRIIDYKTGKGDLRFRNMSDLFDKELKDRPKAVMQVFMYAHLYLLEHPEVEIIEPGIYYLRNLFNDKFEPGVLHKPDSGSGVRVTDFAKYRQEFKELFDASVEEILDSEIPFNQTTTGEACKWCAFTNICKR